MRSRSIYCHMIYQGSNQKHIDVRRALIQYAQTYGIKAASRKFGCSRNTVRLWLKRFKDGGASSLLDKTRAPKNIPHKLNKEIEEQIIQAREQVPCYGPKRLKWFFGIDASEGSIYRVLKEKKLLRKKRKKYQKKNDLREVKAKYRALSHHQLDVKYLFDISNYWPQMQDYNLPKYQYTIRDTKSGMIYLGFAKEVSKTNSHLFLEQYFKVLQASGIKLEEVIIQTDNGSEFGGTFRHLDRNDFVEMIQTKGAKHQYIPPGMCNANADVESIHNTIEEEFFDLENFPSKNAFMNKVSGYQLYYNLVRPNFSKKGKTPMQIIEEEQRGNINNLLQECVDLDQLFRIKYKIPKRGQHLPEFPVLALIF